MRYSFGIGIFCLTETGKIDCGDAKNMADKSTKITILIWEA